MLYKALRSALFILDPEKSHDLALPLLNTLAGNSLVKFILRGQHTDTAQHPVSCMGLQFPNRVGLSAGLDKNADFLDGLGALGFGFIEVGTVTPRPQTGNPKPRLFRLASEKAIINRMGFNNKGVDHLVEQVRQRRFKGILGINIGKNADTPISQASDDYLTCLRKVYEHADYVAVNISSPNTPGLRDLQHGAMLKDLFTRLKAEQSQLAKSHGRYVPIAIKIAPDMDDEQIDAFAEHALSSQIDAVIATNTTFSRAGVESSIHAAEAGGLSGQPLSDLSTRTVQRLGIRFADQIPIIGVGGIHDTASAQAKFAAGATLIQIYTGFIYEGPTLIDKLIKAINLNHGKQNP